MTRNTYFILACIVLISSAVFAGEVVVSITTINAEGNGIGKAIGKITASDTKYGLLLKPELSELEPGIHGFHVHVNPNCGPAEKEGKMTAGEAAGAHFDPAKTGKHLGPFGEGHLGDLPPLYITADGKASTEVLAPRLKSTDLKGHAIMIHAGGDNFMDTPKPLGGGGARMACGVAQ